MPSEILAGTPTYWRVDGTGARPMFLLHCTLAHSGAWKGLMQQLADTCYMVAMDLPGHGRSGPRDRSVTWQTQSAAMAVELIKKGAVPVDLVGHSFGATVALRIAVKHPDLVKSLTLIEPVFFSAAKDAGRPEFDAHMALHGGFYDLLDKLDFEGAARAFSEIWGGPVPWRDLPQSQRDYMAARIGMIREGGDSVLGVGPDYIPLSRVAKIDVPVLLVEGAETDPIIDAVQVSLDAVLPNSKRVIVKGAGHMVPITHPGKVAAEMRAFLWP